MTPKNVGITSAAVATVMALAACGGDPSASDGEMAEITFVAPVYSDVTGPYWEDLIAAFEEENPDVDVELRMISWSDIGQTVNTLVATNEAPDLLNIGAFASYAADDLLLPVQEVLPPEVYDDMVPVLRENGQYEGTAYGIPVLASARALFYNKAIFAEAGITEPPQTWAEFREAAEAIEAAGYIGYGMPLGAPEAQGEFSAWLWNNGGDWKSGDNWTIDSPEAVETLQFLSALSSDGLTQVNPATTNRDDLWKVFGQGKIGMIHGANFLPTILEGQGSTVDIGITPTPTNEGAEPATMAVEDYLVVFNSTEHPEAVGSFLAFFYQQDNYTQFLQNEGMLPVTQSAIEEMAEDPQVGTFAELLDEAKFYPSTDPAWPSVQAEAIATLGAVVTGQRSAEDILANLARTAEQSSTG